MDIDDYLEPEFDFSRLGPIELELMKDITFDEVINAFMNKRTRTHPYPGYPLRANRWISVGFSDRARCLGMLFQFNRNHMISFIDINLANDHGIEKLWCDKKAPKS